MAHDLFSVCDFCIFSLGPSLSNNTWGCVNVNVLCIKKKCLIHHLNWNLWFRQTFHEMYLFFYDENVTKQTDLLGPFLKSKRNYRKMLFLDACLDAGDAGVGACNKDWVLVRCQWATLLSNNIQYHAILCDTKQYQTKTNNTMRYHVIPCNTMWYHAIPCNTMQYHAIPCNAMHY